MKVALQQTHSRSLLLGSCLLLGATYLTFCTREFLAFHYSHQPHLDSLQRALTLEPANAEYWHLVGRYRMTVNQEPLAALPFLKHATELNPSRAQYWLDLASDYQMLGIADNENNAVEKAIAVDPSTPAVAWEAAGLFWTEGEADRALQEYRIVVENDPYLMGAALERCWRMRPDVNFLLTNLVPPRPDVYATFLEFLMQKNEPAATAEVWKAIKRSHAQISTRYLFDYVRFLLDRKQTEDAYQAWNDGARLSELRAYQASPENLFVNADFEFPILNTGFDWTYQDVAGVSLAVDSTGRFRGRPTLAAVLNSSGFADLGIHQLVPVQPHSEYEFSAWFKPDNIEGAGALHFVLEDRFDGTQYFSSEDLSGHDAWTPVRGSFTTGPASTLLVLRIAHEPAETAIRGSVSIAGLKLVQQRTEAGAE